MSSSPIDYEALAKRAGALVSQPAGVDYTELAKRAGAVASRPAAMVPDAGASGRKAILDEVGEQMRYMAEPETPKGGLLDSFGNLLQSLNPERAYESYVDHMNRPYETASGMPGGGGIEDVPMAAPAVQAGLQLADKNYAGAAGTLAGGAVAAAGPALIIHGALKGAGAVARVAGKVAGKVSPEALLAPQLDPAEAAAVAYGDERGVKMPASVRSGSAPAAVGEKILQHLPWSSKLAKTARAAEQSTLAAAGAQEVGDLGAPDGGPAPSALEVGDRVHARVDQSIADHAEAGSNLVAGGAGPSPLEVGEGVNRASQAKVEAHGKIADDSYNLFRSIADQPQFRAAVQTGMERVATGHVDGAGAPIYELRPKIEEIALPVDRRPAQNALRPVLNQMLRLMPLAQEQASVGIKALRNIVEGPAFESASITDQDLGAVKRIIRESGSAQTVGLANLAVDHLEKAVDAAAERAGPDAVAALQRGRESTVAKYQAIDYQKSLGFQNAGMYGSTPAEPVGVHGSILRPGDRSINLLRAVGEHTPEQLPAVADSLTQSLVDKVRAGNAAGALDDWKGYGEQTKNLLYPEADKAPAIGSYLERAAELQKVKKALPQSDQLVKNLASRGDAGTNTLELVAKHAPDQVPAIGQSLVQHLIEQGTADAGMSKPQSVLRTWLDIGERKKEILFRDPYLTDGGGPKIQNLTNFFTLMKKLGENPNPSGSGVVMGFIKGAALLLTPAGIPVAIGLHRIAQMLFNPETSRLMQTALKMPAGSKGAPLLARQIIEAAGPEATPVSAGTAESVAPAAASVPTSGGGVSNEKTTVTGSGQSEAVPSANRQSAGTGAGTDGGKKPGEHTVQIPGRPGESYQAKYVVKELGDSNASHNGLTFQENPNYKLENQRNYKNAVNQGKIVAWSSDAEFNPDYHVQPSVDALNGPPIEDSAGNVISGNGRHMTQERVYAAGGKAAARLKDAITQRAGEIQGLDPAEVAKMKRPTLRLVIPEEEFQGRGPNAKQNLIADTNEPGTASLTAGERMISDSRRVSEATVHDMGGRLEAIGPEATLGEALAGRSGGEILNKLVADGVVSPQSRAAFMSEGGELTAEGKDRVTRLLVGRFFETPEQLTKLPAVRNQVERIAAPLSQVDSLKEWSLTDKMQEAVTILERAHDLDAKNLDDFFRNDSLFGSKKFSAEAVDLARALKSAPAEAIKSAARQYAGDAVHSSRGASMFGDTSTPAEAFKAAFSPEALEARAAELKAARTPAANVLAGSTPSAEAKNDLAPKQRKPRK